MFLLSTPFLMVVDSILGNQHLVMALVANKADLETKRQVDNEVLSK